MDQKTILEELSIEDSIVRLDNLINKSLPNSIEKMGFILGVRLALEMAREIRDEQPLGSNSGPLIAEWVKKYGDAQAEESIQTARDFLTNTAELKKVLAKHLFREDQ
jgi:hypothetical protein